ncbi:hypothetical protein PR048_005598 [Dryococelus australis]|uniref:Uncharacterized protein n=1 Tax=Dryococelus australis TaxID=614101 RepID=A0ABQ9I980_9NEOP|nr:hypothetical protein PR048_005598 [Dryococelus australis]
MMDLLALGITCVHSIVNLRDNYIHMNAEGERKRKNEDRPLQVTKIKGLNHHIEVIPGTSKTQKNLTSNNKAASDDRETCNNGNDDTHSKISSGISSQMNASTPECEQAETITTVLGLPVRTADYKYPKGPLLCDNCNRNAHPRHPQSPTARQQPLIQQHQQPPPSRQPEQAEWQTVKPRTSNYWQQQSGVHYQTQPPVPLWPNSFYENRYAQLTTDDHNYQYPRPEDILARNRGRTKTINPNMAKNSQNKSKKGPKTTLQHPDTLETMEAETSAARKSPPVDVNTDAEHGLPTIPPPADSTNVPHKAPATTQQLLLPPPPPKSNDKMAAESLKNSKLLGGGVALAIHTALNIVSPIPDLGKIEANTAFLTIKGKQCTIAAMYAPSGKTIEPQDLNKLIRLLTSILALGDLNAKYLALNYIGTTSNCRTLFRHQDHSPYMVCAPYNPTHYPKASNNTLDITIYKNLKESLSEDVKNLIRKSSHVRRLWQRNMLRQHKTEINRLQKAIKDQLADHRATLWDDKFAAFNLKDNFL